MKALRGAPDPAEIDRRAERPQLVEPRAARRTRSAQNVGCIGRRAMPTGYAQLRQKAWLLSPGAFREGAAVEL